MRRTGKRPSPYRDRALELLEQAGSTGMTAAEIRQRTDWTTIEVGNTLYTAGQAGMVFKSGLHNSLRYFIRRDWADEHQARAQEHKAQRIAKAKATTQAERQQRIRQISSQPFKPKQTPRVEIIVPAEVKRVVGPTHAFDPRFQVDPRTRVVGGFATMGIGRYLAPTC